MWIKKDLINIMDYRAICNLKSYIDRLVPYKFPCSMGPVLGIASSRLSDVVNCAAEN